jgi:hypothetical protein
MLPSSAQPDGITVALRVATFRRSCCAQVLVDKLDRSLLLDYVSPIYNNVYADQRNIIAGRRWSAIRLR